MHIVYVPLFIHQVLVVFTVLLVVSVALVVVNLDTLVGLSFVKYKLALDPDVFVAQGPSGVVSLFRFSVSLSILNNQLVLVSEGNIGGLSISNYLLETRVFMVELGKLLLDHGTLRRAELEIFIFIIPAYEPPDATPSHVGVDHMVAFLKAHGFCFFPSNNTVKVRVIVE
jgi:hypothetical protein